MRHFVFIDDSLSMNMNYSISGVFSSIFGKCLFNWELGLGGDSCFYILDVYNWACVLLSNFYTHCINISFSNYMYR